MAFGYKPTLAQQDINCAYINCNKFIERNRMVWHHTIVANRIICHECYTLLRRMQERLEVKLK